MKKKVIPIKIDDEYECECGEELDGNELYCPSCNSRILWNTRIKKKRRKSKVMKYIVLIVLTIFAGIKIYKDTKEYTKWK